MTNSLNERMPYWIGMKPLEGADISALATQLKSRGFEQVSHGPYGESKTWEYLNVWKKPMGRERDSPVLIVNALIADDITARIANTGMEYRWEEETRVCEELSGILNPQYIEFFSQVGRSEKQQYGGVGAENKDYMRPAVPDNDRRTTRGREKEIGHFVQHGAP